MTSIICTAIDQRQLIYFRFHDIERVVQPATHGYHRGTGSEVVRGYQVLGASKSGPIPDWRLYRVKIMEDVQVLDETFATDPRDYVRGDSQIAVHCQL